MANGPRPEGDWVIRHKCDVRHCVNPDHLEIGTRADNQNDMKVRNRSCYGEVHPNAKLTEESVRQIRADFASGVRKASLAREYGVSFMTITRAVRGECWARVT